jgi:hypothetical protein
MIARVYDFPTGKKQPLGAWRAPVSATVAFIGVRQTLVPDRGGVYSQEPYFLVQVYTAGDEKANFSIEVEGVIGLHAVLNLMVDAAHTRGQDFCLTDCTDGKADLPEECRPENQL